MKEIVKISLSGISFPLDDAAYRLLKDYFDKLENGYRDNADGKEIVADIEARIAELILSEQDNTHVVGSDLISRIVTQLGLPDDIDNAPATDFSERIPRRFYRNRENSRLGGVCSGMAAYTDSDPVWFRLGIFVPMLLSILLSTFGVCKQFGNFLDVLFLLFVLLYFMLWFAVPSAKTPRQKLEMRGEKITASSIQRNLAKSSSTPSGGRIASLLGEILCVAGRALILAVKVLLGLLGFGFAACIVSIIVVCIALLIDVPIMRMDDMQIFATMDIRPWLFFSLAALTFLIPLGLMTWLIFKSIFRFKSRPVMCAVLIAAWFIIAGFFSYTLLRNVGKMHTVKPYVHLVRSINAINDINTSGDWEVVRDDSVLFSTAGRTRSDIIIGFDKHCIELRDRSDSTSLEIDLEGRAATVLSDSSAIYGLDLGDIQIHRTDL